MPKVEACRFSDRLLGRAAAVVEYEITTTLNVLRKAFSASSPTYTEQDMEEYRRKIDRLSQMSEVLQSFAPKQDNHTAIHDLNTIVLEKTGLLKPLARKNNLSLRLELDSS